jgi:FdhE protein
LSELDRIQSRLDELLYSDPHLVQPVAYYRALTAVLQAGHPLAELPVPEPAVSQARLAANEPLFNGHSLTFAPAPTLDFFQRICTAIAPYQPGALQALGALDAGRLDLPALLPAVIAGDTEFIGAAAVTAEVAILTLRVLLEYTLRPTLRAWAARLLAEVSLEDWQPPVCPLCGSVPVMAELHKAKRLRLLRCGICGSAWPYPIQRCAHCGTEEPGSQGVILSDEDQHNLAQICRKCHTYLKTIITEDPIPHDLLALEDLASVYLDQGCREKGYTRIVTNE